jgi:hypothetical protein
LAPQPAAAVSLPRAMFFFILRWKKEETEQFCSPLRHLVNIKVPNPETQSTKKRERGGEGRNWKKFVLAAIVSFLTCNYNLLLGVDHCSFNRC